jgi:putative mycofactocin binding protein MftB
MMLDEAWVLSPAVALRPETFGALAYHFGNRKLIFLKRRDLVAVVEALPSSPTVAHALSAAGIPTHQRDAYLAALRSLAAADMIQPRDNQELSA